MRWEIGGHLKGSRFHRTTATSFRPPKEGGGANQRLPSRSRAANQFQSFVVGDAAGMGGYPRPPTPHVEGAGAVIWNTQTKQGGFQASSKEPSEVSRSRLVAHRQGRLCICRAASHPTGRGGGHSSGWAEPCWSGVVPFLCAKRLSLDWARITTKRVLVVSPNQVPVDRARCLWTV